jgi:hypothetical protein
MRTGAVATIRAFHPGEPRPARCSHAPARNGSCRQPPEYLTTLTHMVMKAGHQPREVTRMTKACTDHATPFAAKYGLLPLPAVVVEAVAA